MTRTDNISYLTFDVFGTVVDWRASLIAAVEEVALDKGVALDGVAFVDEWKTCYRSGMDRVNSGSEPWTNVDVIYRRKLDQLIEEYGLTSLSESERDHLNRAWTRLTPWPDAVTGLKRLQQGFVVSTLSNGNFVWLVEMARYGGLSWDCILTAENARRYKPDPAVYQMAIELFGGAPEQIMMVAAHNYDLGHAASHGMRTAFVRRPVEYGPKQQTDLEAEKDWDVVADDLIDLAEQLGV